jgi:tRNA(Leu) C34 or U34 (ribose-2'-O)-methylase TrmL
VRAAVALINPKFPRNVGNVLRACSNFGAEALFWTPERVPDPEDWPKGSRLPREERMKLYRDVFVATPARSDLIDVANYCGNGQHGRSGEPYTPVAVEVRDNAEPLPQFEHPERALYVFGPEDGSLNRGILTVCHRFVVIPTTSCLNLAAAVNVVLYDRLAKMGGGFTPHGGHVYAGAES